MAISIEMFDGLISELNQQKIVCSTIKEKLTEENKKMMALESKVLGYLEELGRDEYRSNVASVSKMEQWNFRLPESPIDKKLFFDYLKEQNLFDAMATVQSQSYNAFCRSKFQEAVDEGLGMDFSLPGVPSPTLHKRLNFRKG